ncbi:carboxymuconolactone decarboxylase family protein [Micromonospora sp. WMMA1363]|uniref:carboxymuconolactone decarboxylase family protein n=1 Tax=Micromonospora sp. WMMA1363 TaxID=3053985 RepID=UPI00259CD326|nr:carboxymuconolactone decarboxylase family protein [Micromonospora sp. WMMA1363]MDM4719258.1 carboxymuconolactone decarboxylase family protein [Micromonospora sp. WMMA1363]
MVAGRVVSSVVQRQVRYVRPVPVPTAAGVVGAVYGQAAEEMRIVNPPVLLHSSAPPVLAAYWMLMREPLLATGNAGRLAKEAVAAAVSVANICPYCADMHSTGMYELGDAGDAEAIVADRVEQVRDEAVRQVAGWARSAHLADLPGVADAPFGEADRPELVGVLVAFHYLTRMVNVFLANFLLPPGLGSSARRRLKFGISRLLRPTLREPYPPGRALSLLPPADLPADARWAAGNPAVAAAVARSYAAFEAAGKRTLTPAVRERVLRRLADWRGEETGISRQWCEDSVVDLSPADRAAGRLALLTAFASYQVDEEVVDEFRAHHPDDRSLVEAAAWSSFAAARRVGSHHVPRSYLLHR